MFVVGSGNSSGTVLHRLVLDQLVVTTTRHSVEECAAGLHYHERPHLSLVLRGGDVEARARACTRREPGALAFYPAGDVHGSVSRDAESIHANVEFGPDFFDTIDVCADDVAARLARRHDAALLVLRTQAELCSGNTSHAALAIEAIVVDLVTPRRSERAHPAWVDRVEEALIDGWSERLSLSRLAAIGGVHPVTVSREFRRHVGTSLTAYLRRLRVSRSVPRITGGTTPLSQVAFEWGFADQSHLTRAMREETGFSPGALRRLGAQTDRQRRAPR
ncbi:MAG: AraC family transcriptional regulator [Gemmatimonadaceae bacterium]|jgi:AraC family transcriptional regulator|nr:AraC family transcriptional regulator [Gemmatimonadaceae bacterium]